MGTRRVCSKLAKLHSNFPLNTPSQSPIGLSCKRRRRERRETLAGAVHLAQTHLVEATSVSVSTCLHRFTVAKNAALVWSSASSWFLHFLQQPRPLPGSQDYVPAGILRRVRRPALLAGGGRARLDAEGGRTVDSPQLPAGPLPHCWVIQR